MNAAKQEKINHANMMLGRLDSSEVRVAICLIERAFEVLAGGAAQAEVLLKDIEKDSEGRVDAWQVNHALPHLWDMRVCKAKMNKAGTAVIVTSFDFWGW